MAGFARRRSDGLSAVAGGVLVLRGFDALA